MNITLIQEQMAYIELALETEDEFEIYGGTTRAPFEFIPTGVASWRVIVRESEVAGAAIRSFDIYARQRSSGREWVVLSGRIMVKPRTADIEGDKLSPVEYHVTVPVVDSVVETQGMAIVTGIPGPQGPKGEPGEPGKDGNVTAEAIQAVAPIAWTENDKKPTVAGVNSLTVGKDSKSGGNGICFGVSATANGQSVAMGYNAVADCSYGVSVGNNSKTANNAVTVGYFATTRKPTAVTIGSQFKELVNSVEVTNPCTTEGSGSITIGAGANTKNPTNADGTPVLDDKGKPVESSNSVTIGCKALNTWYDSVVLGAQAKSTQSATISIGADAYAFGLEAIAIGKSARGNWNAVAIGSNTSTSSASVAIGYYSATQQSGVAIGNRATITGTTAADGTVTPSTNSTVIGYGASASAPNAVVLGAGASTAGNGTIVIGAGTTLAAGVGNIVNAVLIGKGAKSTGAWASGSLCIGADAAISGDAAAALGSRASAETAGFALGTDSKAGTYSTAIGYTCVNKNTGTTAIKQACTKDGTKYATQFYIMGANSPLAVEYEDGEACMGYVVRNEGTGELLAAGTQKLSVLFPNNSTFQPAMLGLDDEMTPPKVFHPSDLDLPIEEPTEPEDVEINMPEPEVQEYTPLPVYPIVEPTEDELRTPTGEN